MKISLLFSFVFFLTSAIAQNAGKISGSVSKADKPIEGATISLLRAKDSATIKLSVSNKQGGYSFNALADGKYLILVSAIGHKKAISKVNEVTSEQRSIEIPLISLTEVSKSLTGVTVTAVKPMVEQQDDRLIYNVDQDPSAKSESASDLLRKTPYVNVDGDGAIQVNGQTNFKVLLNGRETALFSQNVKDALKGFPGATISRIEVITSPSAKYDAEGVGGIINIITIKKLAGYNGIINANINSIGNKSAGFNINLKTGKLGISALYSRISNSGIRTNQLAVTTPVNSIAFVSRKVGGERETELFQHQGNLELSYDLDSTNTLVVYGSIGKNNNEAMNQYTFNTLFTNGNSDIDPFLLETKIVLPTHGFGSDFIRKYKGKPQKELSVRFNAIYNTSRFFSNSQQELGPSDRFLLNNSEAFNSEYTVQLDFIEPINKTTRVETGVKTIFRGAHSDFESLIKYNKAEPYRIDPANSNKFAYDQNVYGGYATLNKIMKAVTARIGLRVEHTRVDGDFTSTNTIVRQVYTNFVPNVLLSRQFSKTMNSNLTYNLRLGRPSIQALNPFVNNSDSLNRSFGNPNLGPQYMHSIAWQNRFFKGNKFISIQTGYNFANNLIIPNPTFDPATGITSISGANVGQIREFNLGFVSNLPVGAKWNIAVNTTGRFAKVRNRLQTSWTNIMAGNVNGNFTYKASKLFTITANGGYAVPLRTPNNTFPDNYFYGFNLIQKLFKEKLTVTASALNFFKKERTLIFLTENENFVTENRNNILFRNFGLAMTYSFGKLKENVSKKKGVNNDDQVQ